MSYATEYLANAIKAARKSKGLSQRELSDKSGIPQGHISKIENHAVDLRVSSLVALARALDLELTLVPRKTVPAVQSIVRSSARSTLQAGAGARQWQKELARIQKSIASASEIASFAKPAEQFQRYVRELQQFRLAGLDIKALRNINTAVQAIKNNSSNVDAIRQAFSQLQSLRNELAHSSANLPWIESARPAYDLEDDDDG